MEYDAIDALREGHAAWRVLRADNAVLILSFLGRFFVDENRGACAGSEVAAASIPTASPSWTTCVLGSRRPLRC